MKTTSAKVTKKETIELIEYELPVLGKDQVLIKVLSCGVCATEVNVFNGKTIGTHGVSFHYKTFPADLGHEVVGHVEEKGSNVTRFNIGDCVTGLTYSGCGFSTYVIEDENVLVKVKTQEKGEQMYCIGEPLMATTNILNQINPSFGDIITIIGDGFMSLLLISALSRFPLKELIVVGHHSKRLKLASKFGASRIINSKEEDAWKEIFKIAPQGVDISIEYAGNVESLKLAASICKPKQRAKLVMASSYSNEMPFTIANFLQNRAPILIPAYPHQSLNKEKDLERGIWGFDSGIYPMRELITHKYKLDRANEAFLDNINRKSGYIKGIILPNS